MASLSFHHRFQPAPGKSTRVLLALHGTGGDEDSLIPVAALIDPEAAVLGVRGKVSEQGANRYFRRLAEGVFDLEDLAARTIELADFIEDVSKSYGFSLENLYALGYSNGANIASSMLLRRPSLMAGAILLRAMVPFQPVEAHDLTGKRVFLSQGKFDPIVPLSQADQLAGLLRGHGADVTLHWNELDHRFTRPELAVARGWLHNG